ncbi:MAG TPA: GNAT family N-acetyltransferase [Desulfobulbaceae bacterium]|nr:GNAT family N-acetyltransferase [Desulfobulbaceae bacterium]
MLCKPLSTFLLVQEMFRQQGNQIAMTVGKLIPYESYGRLPISRGETATLIKKHVYCLDKRKTPILRTVSGIARPEHRSDLKKELKGAALLGRTPDNKKIFLHTSTKPSPVIREIGRLREITFRTVGEGTGHRRDMDHFDRYYSHLVLWDEDDLEIVGAYRFVDAQATLEKKGPEGLYTNTLFTLDPSTHYFLNPGLELGRSFVQKQYWGKRSLDYLWYGIGAYLAENPHYRYLYGPVSLSGNLPETAKELLIYFYRLYFSPDDAASCSKKPYRFSSPVQDLAREFSGDNYKKDFKRLKFLLANLGTAVPTLYKQYSQLCRPGGVQFIDFNVDPDFNNCVDGLVVVDLHRLKKKKRLRYIGAACAAESLNSGNSPA